MGDEKILSHSCWKHLHSWLIKHNTNRFSLNSFEFILVYGFWSFIHRKRKCNQTPNFVQTICAFVQLRLSATFFFLTVFVWRARFMQARSARENSISYRCFPNSRWADSRHGFIMVISYYVIIFMHAATSFYFDVELSSVNNNDALLPFGIRWLQFVWFEIHRRRPFTCLFLGYLVAHFQMDIDIHLIRFIVLM